MLTHRTYTGLSPKFEQHLCFTQTIICFYSQAIGPSAEGKELEAGTALGSLSLWGRAHCWPATCPMRLFWETRCLRERWASSHNVHIFKTFLFMLLVLKKIRAAVQEGFASGMMRQLRCKELLVADMPELTRVLPGGGFLSKENLLTPTSASTWV